MVDLNGILIKAAKDEITRDEALIVLKKVQSYDKLMDLFKVATKVRIEEIGYVYKFEAFMGPITKCTTNPPCKYCRRSRKDRSAFDNPLSLNEIEVGTKLIEETGVKRLEIGGGTLWKGAGEKVINAVKVIKKIAPNLKIRINVGPALTKDDLIKLKELGVEEVSSNFETINETVFRNVKPGDNLKARMELAKNIDSIGLKLSTTMMIGIGSTYEDYVDHMFWFKDNIKNLSRFSITALRPIPGTPMESRPMASPIEAAKIGAVARLIFRNVDICFGGIMNDIRLLPLRVMAGGNREIHLSVSVHRKWDFRLLSPSETKIIEFDGFRFINNLPLITRIIRDLGLKPESP